MHGGMAVEAALHQHRCAVNRGRIDLARVKSTAGMVGGAVTTLAQEWNTAGEQCRLIGAVTYVTYAAVLAHRRVLPQERSTLVGMTAVARLVERHARE